MMKKPNVRYYHIKDYNLIALCRKLIKLNVSVREDIRNFIETFAPSATLSQIRTEGNLQLKYMAFQWKFPSLKHIPDNTYTNFKFVQDGVLAEPDINTEEGKKLREDQMDLLNACTVDGYELWYEEMAPLLNWEVIEEPGLLYNLENNIFILVTDKIAPHGSYAEYKPPSGVVNIPKSKVMELLPEFN